MIADSRLSVNTQPTDNAAKIWLPENSQPLYFLRPKNAQQVIACAVYHYHRPPHSKVGWSDRAYLLQKPPGIAWDSDVIQRLDADNVTLLAVRLKTTGTVYYSTLENLYRHGKYQNRPAGLQLVMTLRYWAVELPEVEQPAAPVAEQLSLFGGTA
ncbi:MAG: hypothetical protein H6641_15720 [Caldilineaceae bacterium]|nr:hypothetical protein [Caldilineaceae bacterium]